VLSGAALERIEASPIRELIMTDTIPIGARQCSKIRVLSVARVFAEAIERIYEDLPVSSLFTSTPNGLHPIQMRISVTKEDMD
jgi:ribose-phosphate pyrophosphokinase